MTVVSWDTILARSREAYCPQINTIPLPLISYLIIILYKMKYTRKSHRVTLLRKHQQISN